MVLDIDNGDVFLLYSIIVCYKVLTIYFLLV